ncbi:bifunctional UDP-N-acetylglucosamine diphosphorylase/glucosamine-1-phosphate N-acetyltransferase GlmU [Methylobrevis albus]|uniref:Bifunctional protein GlmU n=1 Tax=Methylobrevis albus TaxID=2793297 RepID=A0A931I3Z7_9HYPH|nr:bifunctional UDP-N-acetylglucosamine diphosphorylase/glucosamine-1-phosphate N-acetyltransferase GlmU [Methylobrevis albus]MBH0238835.1 bifunctional UDP-N-acetylglucosamine diphosphorylase/glucosamine-1-phosphate N-acetyltransferase GlmU [Methylobrevis albus]
MTDTAACLAVVLAAGEGTRMKSALPKVMHAVGGLPMVDHVIAAARAAGADRLAVVIGAGADTVRGHLARTAGDAAVFEQAERRGTAHAVLAARPALEAGAAHVVILYGDTPLVRPATIAALRAALADGADVAVLGFEPADPTGYGRLVEDGGRLARIVEEKDAGPEEKAIRRCNAGLMAFRGEHLPALLDRIGNANAKGEFYLTDAIELAGAAGLTATVVLSGADEVAGVNDRVQLAAAEAVFQAERRQAAMLAGATLAAPKTVFFAHDTVLGRDVVVEPNVVFGPGVTVEDGAVIRAFSHLEGARVGAGATIGPYARLRPGADLAAGAHIGNFVEIKNADIGAGAKVNHLTYIGDASIGAGSNIGAGTITCNYDGVFKSRTVIGAGVFVGSNTTLVAPVSVGDGGYTAAGSVITRDVPADAMAFGRARQVVKEGHAAKVRAALKAKKAEMAKG